MTQALLGYYDFDTLRLRYRANAAPAALGAYILYEYDGEPGKSYRDDVPDITTFTTTWSDTLTEADPVGGSQGGCKVVGGGVWIRSSTTSLVKGSMYVRLLVQRAGSSQEECLCCGYIYDIKSFLTIGEHADLETPDTAAQMDVTYQQVNVAGGAVVVDITPGAGNSFEVLDGYVSNSGTNTIQVVRTTTGNALGPYFIQVASGAANNVSFAKGLHSTTQTTGNSTGIGPNLTTFGTDRLTIRQNVAGAQNDTIRIFLTIRVKGALPTVDKSRSTNEADVGVTAGAASFAFVS